MRLDHLTFAQLHKLKNESTLMRVTAAYHKALRRYWDDNDGFGSIEFYTVTLAEAYCPEFCAPWKRVLAFLRSDELKSALRKAADAQSVVNSGEWLEFRNISRFKMPNRAARSALALLVFYWCRSNGVEARIREISPLGDEYEGRFSGGDFDIHVQTNAEGLMLLESKTGMRWEDIVTILDGLRWFGRYWVSAKPLKSNDIIHQVFWWLPWTDDKTGWRINPALWPVNTPDYQETAKQLVGQ